MPTSFVACRKNTSLGLVAHLMIIAAWSNSEFVKPLTSFDVTLRVLKSNMSKVSAFCLNYFTEIYSCSQKFLVTGVKYLCL